MSDFGGVSAIGTVLAVASEIYGTDIKADSDLISVGFDSIEMIQLANRLGEELGVPCAIDDVLASPSLAGLAGVMDRRIDEVGAR